LLKATTPLIRQCRIFALRLLASHVQYLQDELTLGVMKQQADLPMTRR